MKITKARLKQIIKEEIQRVVSEADYTTRTVSGAEAAAMGDVGQGPEVRGHSQARRDAYRAARREEDIKMGAKNLLDQIEQYYSGHNKGLDAFMPDGRTRVRYVKEAATEAIAKYQADLKAQGKLSYDPDSEMGTAIRMKAAEMATYYFPGVEYSDSQEY